MANKDQITNSAEIRANNQMEVNKPEKNPEQEEAEQAVLEQEQVRLINDNEEQENMDNLRINELRAVLNPEKSGPQSVQIFKSKEGIADFDTALGELVLEDRPDKIVENILTNIQDGFIIEDGNLGEIEKSIRIWLTESAGNAARHISYRQNEDKDVQYSINISCETLTEEDKKYLQIAMTDNGIGIMPEDLSKIGSERFTTSNENEQVAGDLHAGGHGRFSVDYKKDIASPRGWEMRIRNRDDGERGAVAFLKIPVKK